jgi:hypothetical protein
MAGEILLVARLLPDEHDRRRARAFAEDGLGADLPQVTAAAACRCSSKGGQRAAGRKEVRGAAR